MTGVKITEKVFQTRVLDLARLYRLAVYHTYDSRRSNPGFPDLVVVGHHQVLYAELKTETGRMSPHQILWQRRLQAAGCEYHLWRPSDYDTIHDRFKAMAHPHREQI